MTVPAPSPDSFIQKWSRVSASELSTSQSFLIDLCTLLGVATPHATADQEYMFERPVTFTHGDGTTSAGRIDLYRRGAFVLESKKLKAPTHTKGFDDALLRARSQAEAYARALPSGEGRPPFVVVVDVGHRIELYAEFSRTGATYTPYPDPSSHRITLEDLRRPEILDRLRRLWADPLSLDPSRESARVTRQIASKLADLARSLEESGNEPEAVAQFMQRAIFTMFAEDVGLLPPNAFRDLLAKHGDDPDVAGQMLGALWRDMDTGGFSAVLANKVLRFNGKLFKEPNVLPLTKAQLLALLEAARADWRHVEPAIFGTLLERALSPRERHKLGAHYTPRAYVERLVLPTVIDPLRAEWSAAHAAALTLAAEAKPKEAIAELLKFHHRLCNVKCLDPSCGSGNFLFVTLEHLKRLEGEVLNALDDLGHRQSGLDLDAKRADVAAGETVDPHNLLGIEINPRAAALAELVLWIGYLQWHFRTRGDVSPPEPVVRDFRNIENRDAVLAHDGIEIETDERGMPVTRWDGITTKISPVTGEEVPDDAARKPKERYVNPRKAAWPHADFIVGNPPFIGNKRMRTALGDGYVEALRVAWPEVPDSADFVMYWWHHAAALCRRGAVQQFGLITTNSIRQSFNRRILETHLGDKKSPLFLAFAIPDHPWVEATDGAAVRITMTVGTAIPTQGRLLEVSSEKTGMDGEVEVDLRQATGWIGPAVRLGASVTHTVPLAANRGLCWQGVKLVGDGFLVAADDQAKMRQAGSQVIRRYLSGRDLVQRNRSLEVIDFAGLSVDEARNANPLAFQHVLDHVKPLRDQNREESRRRNWWLFGRTNENMRRALVGLKRFVVTPEVAKFRPFVFASDVIPDASLYAIAADDALTLGVLSSAVHATWAAFAGGTLEDRPRYHGGTCFDRFPFPGAVNEASRAASASAVSVGSNAAQATSAGEGLSHRIGILAEQLDAHRKLQQAQHPGLTLTSIYNVLASLRSGQKLTAKERIVHEQGLVSILRQLHDELDEAVLLAYGWADLLPVLRVSHGNETSGLGLSYTQAKRQFDEMVVERLVALNAERAAEEAKGHVRAIRPDFQISGPHVPMQVEMEESDEPVASTSNLAGARKPAPWPKDAVDQVRAVADLLAQSSTPLSMEEIGTRFTARGTWKKRLPQLLEMLVAVGRAEKRPTGYVTRA